MLIMGGLFYTDGGTRVVDGETLAGWGVISRSPYGRIDVMFGPVVTTEAHLAVCGARIHSNNTAEMTAMIEALSFLGPRGPVTHDEQSCIYDDSMHAAGIRLGTIQGRTHVQLAGCLSPCTCIVIVEIWVTNVLTMPLHLAHLDSSLTTTLPHAGFIITLTLLCVLMAVTTSARSWNDCSTFEQMQRRFIKTGDSVGFSHRVHRVHCAFHVTYGRVCLLLSAFSLWILASPNSDGQTLFIRVYRTEY